MANQIHCLRAGCRIVLDDISYLYHCGKIDAEEKATMISAVKEALKSGDTGPLKRLVESQKRKMDPSIYDEILAMM